MKVMNSFLVSAAEQPKAAHIIITAPVIIKA